MILEIGYVSHTRGNKVICYSTVDKIPQSGTKIYVKELKAIGTVDKRLTKNGPVRSILFYKFFFSLRAFWVRLFQLAYSSTQIFVSHFEMEV